MGKILSPHRGYRSCIVCRRRELKKSLCRVSLEREGEEKRRVVVDSRNRVQCRGAYIHLSLECIKKFNTKTLNHNFRKQLKQISRAHTVLAPENLEEVREELFKLVSDNENA